MLAITPLWHSLLLPSASALELRSDAWLIGGSVHLTVLERIDGLNRLPLVGDLEVSDNASLHDISGLASASPVITSASVYRHPALCEARVQAVFATITHSRRSTSRNLGVCP